jgi:dienelactone hydrolase
MFRDQTGSVVERPLTFGPGATLVGIESSSATSRAIAGRPAVVLLNAGLVHRVGPNRLHVAIARRLAAAGYPALRFDLAGRGDSEPRTDGLSFLAGALADAKAAMDYLQQTRGVDRFVLMGICSGAVNALQAAIVDSRVAGAIVIDAPAYPTRGYYVRYYAKRLANLDSWRNTLLARNALGRRLFGGTRSANRGNRDDFGVPEGESKMPSREEAERALLTVADRGAKLLVIFSGTWSGYNYRHQFRDAFPTLKKRGAVTLEYFKDADHTFTRIANQERLVGTIARWVATTWPATRDRSLSAAESSAVEAGPDVAYTVDCPSLDAARADVLRVASENLPPGAERGQRYEWLYEANPSGAGAVFVLYASNKSAAVRPVGCTGVSPRLFSHAGGQLTAALSTDFAIDQRHGAGNTARRLQQSATEYVRSRFDLAYGFPNAAVAGVFLELGYFELGRMARYVKILRHEPFFRRDSRLAAIAPAGAFVMDRAAALRERRLVATVPDGLVFEWLADFDQRCDSLATELAAAVPIVGERSAGWLRWRFGDASGSVGAIAALTDRATGAIRAYAVIAPKEPGIARIADLVAARPDDLAALLARLVPELRFQGFESAVVTFLGPHWVQAVLTHQGFRLRDAERFVVVNTMQQASAVFTDPQNWYLTAADSDT